MRIRGAKKETDQSCSFDLTFRKSSSVGENREEHFLLSGEEERESMVGQKRGGDCLYTILRKKFYTERSYLKGDGWEKDQWLENHRMGADGESRLGIRVGDTHCSRKEGGSWNS